MPLELTNPTRTNTQRISIFLPCSYNNALCFLQYTRTNIYSVKVDWERRNVPCGSITESDSYKKRAVIPYTVCFLLWFANKFTLFPWHILHFSIELFTVWTVSELPNVATGHNLRRKYVADCYKLEVFTSVIHFLRPQKNLLCTLHFF